MNFHITLDTNGANLVIAGLQHLPMKDSRAFHDALVAELKRQEAEASEQPPPEVSE